MPNDSDYSVDPMAAFYAAVTAVENGQIGEVELEFRKETEDFETIVTMSVRKEIKPTQFLMPTHSTGE